jgi:hypothetical protein
MQRTPYAAKSVGFKNRRIGRLVQERKMRIRGVGYPHNSVIFLFFSGVLDAPKTGENIEQDAGEQRQQNRAARGVYKREINAVDAKIAQFRDHQIEDMLRGGVRAAGAAISGQSVTKNRSGEED